jgi:hypothetical protein
MPTKERPRSKYEISSQWIWLVIGLAGIAGAVATGKWGILVLDVAVVARAFHTFSTPAKEPDVSKSGLERMRDGD